MSHCTQKKFIWVYLYYLAVTIQLGVVLQPLRQTAWYTQTKLWLPTLNATNLAPSSRELRCTEYWPFCCTQHRHSCINVLKSHLHLKISLHPSRLTTWLHPTKLLLHPITLLNKKFCCTQRLKRSVSHGRHGCPNRSNLLLHPTHRWALTQHV